MIGIGRGQRARPVRARVLGTVIASLLRAVKVSWHVHAEGLDALDQRLARQEALIAVFWHGQYPALLPLLHGRRACVFTSLSRRGDVIAEILETLGYQAVQIADAGGDQSLAIMREALADRRSAALAVDGPLGPPHVVHRGVVRLASDLGHAIVPLAVAASTARMLDTRWDAMMLPLPFAHLTLVAGSPFKVPAGLADDALGEWIERTRCALERADGRARALMQDGMSDKPVA